MSVSLPIGFNFRATKPYVTDNSPDLPIIDTDTYAASPGYGWTGTPYSGFFVNYSTGVDPRFAGRYSASNSLGATYAEFRIDVTGNINIRVALGDDEHDYSDGHIMKFFDGSSGTPFASINVATLAGQYADATGVVRTSKSDWLSNNAAVNRTISGGYLRFQLGDGSSAGYHALTHLDIAAAGGGGGGSQPPFNPWPLRAPVLAQ